MAPFIAGLLKAGLGLAANAALAKGKEYLEEKTGVKIDLEKPPTAEQLVAVKQAEMQHEEEMAKIRQEDNRLEIADRASAREREVKIATSPDAPMLNKVITPVLALGIVSLTFLTCGALIFVADGDLKPSQERVIIFIIGALVPICTQVVSYYFGSSRGDAAKDQHIREMMKSGNGAGS